MKKNTINVINYKDGYDNKQMTKKQRIMYNYLNTKNKYQIPLLYNNKLFKPNLFKLENSIPDGNCLFESIHKVLLSYEQSNFNIDGLNKNVDISVTGLRECVSDSITEDQFYFLKEIYTHAISERDRNILHDYDFMHGIDYLHQLQQIIKTTDYWGDDMALDAIEEKYKALRFIVIKEEDNELKICQRLQKNKESIGCVFLYLKNKHYQLITIDGHYVDKSKYKKNSFFVIWPKQLIHQLIIDEKTLKEVNNIISS